MAGAGFKVFNTGDVLTASDVNTFLQQQTVMVFASSAARTSALSGVLAEGMVTYLQDTNGVEVYNGTAFVAVGGSSPLTTKGDLYTFSTVDARLGVGANGTVLTANSATATGLEFATPASGGISLISETVASTLANLTFTAIPATFKDLLLVWHGCFTSNDTRFNIRLNNDSGTNYSGNKLEMPGGAPSFSVTNGDNVSTTTFEVPMINGQTSSTDYHKQWQGRLIVYNYASASLFKKYDFQTGGERTNVGDRGGTVNGTYKNTTAITSIDIIRDSGNGTFSNATSTSIRLYGIS